MRSRHRLTVEFLLGFASAGALVGLLVGLMLFAGNDATRVIVPGQAHGFLTEEEFDKAYSELFWGDSRVRVFGGIALAVSVAIYVAALRLVKHADREEMEEAIARWEESRANANGDSGGAVT